MNPTANGRATAAGSDPVDRIVYAFSSRRCQTTHAKWRETIIFQKIVSTIWPVRFNARGLSPRPIPPNRHEKFSRSVSPEQGDLSDSPHEHDANQYDENTDGPWPACCRCALTSFYRGAKTGTIIRQNNYTRPHQRRASWTTPSTTTGNVGFQK